MSYKSVVCEFQIIYALYSPQGFAVTYAVLPRTSLHDTPNITRLDGFNRYSQELPNAAFKTKFGRHV